MYDLNRWRMLFKGEGRTELSSERPYRPSVVMIFSVVTDLPFWSIKFRNSFILYVPAGMI